MSKFNRSLLPESARGKMFLLTGQSGAGKSTASLMDPHNTVYIDADHLKAEEIARQKAGITYIPVNSDLGNDLVRAGELTIEAMNSVDTEKTTTVVLDNINEIEESLQAYAIANPVKVANMFKLRQKNIVGRAWGEDSRAADRLVKGFVDRMLHHNVAVIVIAHMKNRWGAVGQLEIRGRNWLYEAASLVGIMIRTASAPDMLVFKNAFIYHETVDVNTLTDEQFEQYRNGELDASKVYKRIPNRIPGFTPAKMFRYLARSPQEIEATPYTDEEMLDEDEMSPYVEILTKQQRANLEKIMEQEDQERERALEFERNLKESMRVELDEFIQANPDMEMQELMKHIKTEFSMFAAEINPVYIMKVRQDG